VKKRDRTAHLLMRDSKTHLSYYRARYYDSQAGRFISEDTIQSAPENVNPFAYVGNAPVRFTDPMGFVRVDTSFPPKCLSDLNRAINIARRAAQADAKCNCQFKQMDKQGRSLQNLLDSPDITIHYNPVNEPAPDYEGPGQEAGYTLPGNTHDIWMNPYACDMGRWTLAATLVHELTHIALVPGMGQEGTADLAKMNCGFPETALPTTIVVH